MYLRSSICRDWGLLIKEVGRNPRDEDLVWLAYTKSPNHSHLWWCGNIPFSLERRLQVRERERERERERKGLSLSLSLAPVSQSLWSRCGRTRETSRDCGGCSRTCRGTTTTTTKTTKTTNNVCGGGGDKETPLLLLEH